jgi:large subunit ribosomal protein L24
MKIKKGDNIKVIAGKDKGKTGTVKEAFPKKDMVLVEGVNVLTKHEKARRRGSKGQVVQKAFPIHVSNVMIVDPKTGKPSRVGKKKVGEKMTRVAKKSGQSLS